MTAPATVDLGSGAPGTTITGALGAVTVTDDRALLTASWTADASATDWTTGGGTPAETIPAADVGYDPGTITTTGTITATGTPITLSATVRASRDGRPPGSATTRRPGIRPSPSPFPRPRSAAPTRGRSPSLLQPSVYLAARSRNQGAKLRRSTGAATLALALATGMLSVAEPGGKRGHVGPAFRRPAGTAGNSVPGSSMCPSQRQDNPRALAYIIDYLPTGTVIHRRILVVNEEPRTARFSVYPDAAYISGGQFTGYPGATRSELTTWIRCSTRRSPWPRASPSPT